MSNKVEMAKADMEMMKAHTTSPKGPDKRKQKSSIVTNMVLVAIAGMLIVLCWIFWQKTISVAAVSALNAYGDAKNVANQNAYQEFYDKAFQKAEEKYHTSNDVLISLGSIREESNLEVLRVSNEEYITEDEAFREKGIYLWVSYRGTGIFTVNMKAGEYIVDNARHYVLIRIPEPEMTSFGLDNTQTEQLFYADGTIKWITPILKTELRFGDGSYQMGAELIDSQQQSATRTIRDGITGNPEYYNQAKKSAEEQIQRLVKALNQGTEGLEDMTVQVEFVEMK